MMEMIKGGTTVLYVSHSIDSIKELCSRVIWIEHGKLIKIGPTEEICNEYIQAQLGTNIKDNETKKPKNKK